MDDELLTPDEVCAYLKIKKDWLYDQVEAGHFPCVRVGRQLRFRRSQLIGFLDARSSGAQPPPTPPQRCTQRPEDQ